MCNVHLYLVTQSCMSLFLSGVFVQNDITNVTLVHSFTNFM